MNAKTISQELIEQLNQEAIEFQKSNPNYSPAEACAHVANEHNFELITEDDQCAIYRSPDSEYVNLWVEGVQSEGIEAGGVGFDDQIEWWVEEQENF